MAGALLPLLANRQQNSASWDFKYDVLLAKVGPVFLCGNAFKRASPDLGGVDAEVDGAASCIAASSEQGTCGVDRGHTWLSKTILLSSESWL